MDFVRKAIWGPDPKEQFRKCQQTLRKNKRQMDRQIQDLNSLEKKSKSLIKAAAKKNDMKSARMYAKELRNTQKVNERMHVSRATLDSIEFKLNEQQQLMKLTGSLQKSTEIMRDMNQLIHLPNVSRTVQELSKELTKSGIIDEMVNDVIESAEWEDEDEDENEEVEQLLSSIIGPQSQELEEPEEQLPAHLEVSEEPAAVSEDEADSLILNMRQRLNALQE